MRAAFATVRVALLFSSAGFGAAPLFSQPHADYFYQRRVYGSEAIFHPFLWVINSGFFTLQIDNRANKVFKIQYAAGGKNVLWNLRHPVRALNKYGWKNFITAELIPTSLKKEKAQWAPNYFGHLLGGGIAYRKNLAWYRAQRCAHPVRAALLTQAASSLLNEIVENNGYRGVNVDPLADLLIFEPLGILLFGLGKVENYCGENLDVAYWPMQPALDPFSGALENAGHGFVFKYKPRYSGRVGIFYYFGIQGMAGLSYQAAAGRSFSLALGVAAKYLQPVDAEAEARSLTATLARVAGFFYDQNNSLLFSCLVSPETRYKVRLNFYPGVVRFRGLSPGFSLAFRENREIVMSLNFGLLPLGLAASSP